MRCIITSSYSGIIDRKSGTFLGLVSAHETGGCDRCQGDTPMAVVRLDGEGMFVRLFHPSFVQLEETVTP